MNPTTVETVKIVVVERFEFRMLSNGAVEGRDSAAPPDSADGAWGYQDFSKYGISDGHINMIRGLLVNLTSSFYGMKGAAQSAPLKEAKVQIVAPA